jgi:translation initiation factor 1
MGRKPTKGQRWELIRPGERPAPEPVSLPPAEQRVKVTLEKRKGGRVMTVLEGLVLTAEDRKSLARALKDHLGTGGSAGSETIELQGDHREAVREFLQERGYRLR